MLRWCGILKKKSSKLCSQKDPVSFPATPQRLHLSEGFYCRGEIHGHSNSYKGLAYSPEVLVYYSHGRKQDSVKADTLLEEGTEKSTS